MTVTTSTHKPTVEWLDERLNSHSARINELKVKVRSLTLACFICVAVVIFFITTSCTPKEDNTPPPCYECYHKAYLDSTTLVAQPKYFKCSDDIEAYENKHTGWEGNYYMKMECLKD